MKTMFAKFPGTCKKCGERFPEGTEIAWSPESGAAHVECYSVPGLKNSHPTINYGISNPTHFNPKTDYRYTVGNKTCTGKAQPVQQTEKMVPGVYKLADGRVYAVRMRRDKDGLYAMKMVDNTTDRKMENGQHAKIEFEYEYGIVLGFESDVIKLSDRMSVEEGKKLSTLYGKCIACHRTLKATKSVEDGIGPVCITYFGPVFGTKTAETPDGRDVVVKVA